MKNVSVYGVATALNKGTSCIFFKTLIKSYLFCVLFFIYCIIKGIKVKKIWIWINKVSAHETDFLA